MNIEMLNVEYEQFKEDLEKLRNAINVAMEIPEAGVYVG